MTKEQLIHIAKVGYPPRTQEHIKFDELKMQYIGDVYKLYHKDTPFILTVPSEYEMAIVIMEENNFIQFAVPNNRAFNHYAAINEMEKLGLIGTKQNA